MPTKNLTITTRKSPCGKFRPASTFLFFSCRSNLCFSLKTAVPTRGIASRCASTSASSASTLCQKSCARLLRAFSCNVLVIIFVTCFDSHNDEHNRLPLPLSPEWKSRSPSTRSNKRFSAHLPFTCVFHSPPCVCFVVVCMDPFFVFSSLFASLCGLFFFWHQQQRLLPTCSCCDE